MRIEGDRIEIAGGDTFCVLAVGARTDSREGPEVGSGLLDRGTARAVLGLNDRDLARPVQVSVEDSGKVRLRLLGNYGARKLGPRSLRRPPLSGRWSDWRDAVPDENERSSFHWRMSLDLADLRAVVGGFSERFVNIDASLEDPSALLLTERDEEGCDCQWTAVPTVLLHAEDPEAQANVQRKLLADLLALLPGGRAEIGLGEHLAGPLTLSVRADGLEYSAYLSLLRWRE